MYHFLFPVPFPLFPFLIEAGDPVLRSTSFLHIQENSLIT